VALARFAGFLRRSVADPLIQGLEEGEEVLPRRVERVLDAVEDTEFFLEEPEAEFQVGSVTAAIQEVSRELTREMDTTVKLGLPDRPVRARLAPEALKDAMYLILANAAHFSGGRAVEMSLEEEEGRCRISVRDRGPGFTAEALERGTEPFFTTEEGALGLGLGRAARIVEMHAGELRLGNRDGQGGEVEILLPTRG
jgi:nitrogen fixation/metabolism regulation signal transduction histidine kinase